MPVFVAQRIALSIALKIDAEKTTTRNIVLYTEYYSGWYEYGESCSGRETGDGWNR
jgi:hypothetical protein